MRVAMQCVRRSRLHVARGNALVADFLRGGMHDFEVVRGGQARIAVAARDQQPALGELVVVFQFRVGNGPIDERGPRYRTVGTAGAQLPGPYSRGRAGPVDCRAADGFADPDREWWRGFDRVPAAGLGPRIPPGELSEGFTGSL